MCEPVAQSGFAEKLSGNSLHDSRILSQWWTRTFSDDLFAAGACVAPIVKKGRFMLFSVQKGNGADSLSENLYICPK